MAGKHEHYSIYLVEDGGESSWYAAPSAGAALDEHWQDLEEGPDNKGREGIEASITITRLEHTQEVTVTYDSMDEVPMELLAHIVGDPDADSPVAVVAPARTWSEHYTGLPKPGDAASHPVHLVASTLF